MVNRNAVSVYQTDQVLICIDRVQRRSSRRRPNAVTNSTEYVDVRKNTPCAPGERVVPLLRRRGGAADVRTLILLRPPDRAAAAHGGRQLQHGRRFHPVPVRRPAAGRPLSAADVPAAAGI